MNEKAQRNVYPRVLFAGTFDHLHDGHKHVLSESLRVTTDVLYIGFTTDELISRKRFAVALEPLVLRKEKVDVYMKELIASRSSSVQIVFLETADSIGPAASLDFDALVVTPETESGGVLVNDARRSLGNLPVSMITVPLFHNVSISDKMSSTSIREHICMQLVHGEDDLKTLKESFLLIEETGKWWSIVRDMYGLEPQRYYHNLQHVLELLVQCDPADLHYKEFVMAIWFHDCVYNPSSSTNEEDSVLVLKKFSRETHLSDNIIESVSEVIRMTKDHLLYLREGKTDWAQIFLEMDLSILGAESGRYSEYSEQIKKEYSHVNDYEYERLKFLTRFENFKFSRLPNKSLLNERLMTNIRNSADTIIVQHVIDI